ncbi:oxaloacetate decarboxylase gamma chain [Thalassocella blandensis]|nr:oxaloacetate decarboxylase gamma chain [Thalassocella blandensis]
MQSTLTQQGLDLLIFGMGTVFVFLTLLVVCVTVMSTFINKFLGEEEVANEPKPAPKKAANSANVDPKVLAVIQQAIYQHRAKTQP